MSKVMCGSVSPDNIVASIDEVQRKFGGIANDKRILNGNVRKTEINEIKNTDTVTMANDNNNNSQHEHEANAVQKEKTRNDKMLDYYRYFAPSAATPYPMPFYNPFYNPYYQQQYLPAYYPPYFPTGAEQIDTTQNTDDYSSEDEFTDANDVDDDGSRANTKRRPSNKQNSPIFYIRLPPTPYMFVPGMGYISQVC